MPEFVSKKLKAVKVARFLGKAAKEVGKRILKGFYTQRRETKIETTKDGFKSGSIIKPPYSYH